MSKQRMYTIHANPGCVFDCSCVVKVGCDGETASLEFPQIAQKEDPVGPMVYACMNGTNLTIRLTGVDDSEWGFVWNEKERRWYLTEKPSQKGG